MHQDEDCVNFPTKYKTAQDKQVSNVKTRYTKDGKLLSIDISLVDVGNKKKPSLWYITVNNRTFIVNPTDLHDRYEGLYYFCLSSNVSKQSLKEADFGVDYLITILEKINLSSDTKVINLISKADSIMIISKKNTYIIPTSILDEDLYIRIKEATTLKQILDYNKEEDEEEERKVKRRRKILKLFSSNSLSLHQANIVEMYRFI